VKSLSETHPFFGVASGLLGVAVQWYVDGRAQVVAVCAGTTATDVSNTILFISLIITLSPHNDMEKRRSRAFDEGVEAEDCRFYKHKRLLLICISRDFISDLQ